VNKRSLVFLLSLMLFLCPGRHAATPKIERCVIGRTSAQSGFWKWPPNSRVRVYLRVPDFSESDGAPVELALKNWDAAASENGWDVHFQFSGLTKAIVAGAGTLTLIRNPLYTKTDRHLALLEAHSLRSDTVIDWGIIIVDPKVRDSRVLTNVVAHEIGHSLGLLDCYRCRGGSTAMGLLGGVNKSNGIEGPTSCDSLVVLSGYQDLRTRVARSRDR
jgi:hypothetical protein